jgi:molybdate transport system substrate-binding protein
MNRVVSIFAACLFVFTLFAANVGTAIAEQELIVSAAASLTNVFTDIAKEFEAATPGVKVVLNFAASGALLQQMAKGAPVDVFASADQKTMDQAMEQKLIVPETRKNFAGNELVLIVPADSKVQLASIEDLTTKKVKKVALGNPETVPAGRYAKEVLTRQGHWKKLDSKLVLGESVRQVLDYVIRGEVDAGFVFATDALTAKDKVKVVLEADDHSPIVYPICVVGSSKNKDLAKRFITFVMSPPLGLKVLLRHGFVNP